jgi:hypothetical protein
LRAAEVALQPADGEINQWPGPEEVAFGVTGLAADPSPARQGEPPDDREGVLAVGDHLFVGKRPAR